MFWFCNSCAESFVACANSFSAVASSNILLIKADIATVTKIPPNAFNAALPAVFAAVRARSAVVSACVVPV